MKLPMTSIAGNWWRICNLAPLLLSIWMRIVALWWWLGLVVVVGWSSLRAGCAFSDWLYPIVLLARLFLGM